MDWKCLLGNAGLGINPGFMRDRRTWQILGLGVVLALIGGLVIRSAFPPEPVTGLSLAGLALWQPLLEEIIFRGILQNALADMVGRRYWQGLSLANLLQAGAFSLSHLVHHSPLWAASVMLPALAFGYLADRQGHVAGAFLAHAAWNLAYFGLIPAFF